MGRLASGPNPLGVPRRRVRRRVDRAFVGRLASGPNPFGALGSGRLARGAGPGPKVPTITSSFKVFITFDYVFLSIVLLTLINNFISFKKIHYQLDTKFIARYRQDTNILIYNANILKTPYIISKKKKTIPLIYCDLIPILFIINII